MDEELCLASLQRHDGDIDRSANALLGHANRFARGFAEDLERYPAAAAAAVVDDARGLEVDNNTLAAHTTALDRRRLVAGDAAESAPRRHLLSPPAVPAEREETFLVGDRVDGQDSQGGWYSAVVIATAPDKVRLHYLGWEERHQEWVSADQWESRVASYRTKTQHVWLIASLMATAIEEDIETCVSIVQKSHSRFRTQPNEMIKRFWMEDGDAHKTFCSIVEHRVQVPPDPRRLRNRRAMVLVLLHANRRREKEPQVVSSLLPIDEHAENIWRYVQARSFNVNVPEEVAAQHGGGSQPALQSFESLLEHYGGSINSTSWIEPLRQIGVTSCRDLTSLAPESLLGIVHDLDTAARIIEHARRHLTVGEVVQLNPDLVSPRFGWGKLSLPRGASRHSALATRGTGTVLAVLPSGAAVVKFSQHSCWIGHIASELRRLPLFDIKAVLPNAGRAATVATRTSTEAAAAMMPPHIWTVVRRAKVKVEWKHGAPCLCRLVRPLPILKGEYVGLFRRRTNCDLRYSKPRRDASWEEAERSEHCASSSPPLSSLGLCCDYGRSLVGKMALAQMSGNRHMPYWPVLIIEHLGDLGPDRVRVKWLNKRQAVQVMRVQDLLIGESARKRPLSVGDKVRVLFFVLSHELILHYFNDVI